MQKEGGRDLFLLPCLQAAEKAALLPKSKVEQLKFLEKCVSFDEDRGSVYSKFRLGIYLTWTMLNELNPILSTEKQCQGSEFIFS